MKVRLQIAATADLTFPFEHAGPVVRMGRDPACELALQGEASRSVSWQHARIDLTAGGASVTDLQSSNGTLVNERRIEGTVSIRVGDRIQLGFTGPTMTVTELDLVPAVPAVKAAAPVAPPRMPPERDSTTPIYLGIGGGIAALCLLVLAGYFVLRPRSDDTPPTNSAVVQSSEPTAKANPKPRPTEPRKDPMQEAKPRPAPLPPAPPPLAMVGRYEKPPKSPPSVLAQRASFSDAWKAVRPNETIPTSATLVSLPGYRSTILLDTGVQLTLWGELPQFSRSSPVRESAVVLHFPGAGLDLDFTLDRGRVRLINGTAKEQARVRVRFLEETWELMLPGASEVCLERFALPVRGAGREFVYLFTKGTARLHAAGKEYNLADKSSLHWESNGNQIAPPSQLPGLPDWWTAKLDYKTAPKEVQAAMEALTVWEKTILAEPDKVVHQIQTGAKESEFPTDRTLGTFFLGALDEVTALVDLLDAKPAREVRLAAAEMLGRWLGRNRDHHADLLQLWRKKGYSAEVAELIVQLLYFPSEVQPRQLITYLDHPNFPVRELAHQQLCVLAPQGGSIRYDATLAENERSPGIKEWQKLIAGESVSGGPSPK